MLRADQIVKLIEHRANLGRALVDVNNAAEYIQNQQLAGTGMLWAGLDKTKREIHACIDDVERLIREAKEQMS